MILKLTELTEKCRALPQKCCVFFVLSFLFITPLKADDAQDANKVKAIVALKLIKFCQWQENSKTIKLGLLGKDKLTNELLKLNGKIIDSKKLEVKFIQPKDLEENNYHAVYISRFNKLLPSEKSTIFKKKSILSICDNNKYFLQGCSIYLTVYKKRTRFYINKLANRKRLKIPSSVMRMAINSKELANDLQELRKANDKNIVLQQTSSAIIK